MARRKIRIPGSPDDRGEVGSAFVPLDRRRITETALQLLNEVGLKELSMRRVADALGVKAASLYYHVKDKEELLELLADYISAEIEWLEPTARWEERLLGWAGSFRRALQRHRDAVDIFHASLAVGTNRLLQIEKLFETLHVAGFDDEEIPWVAGMIKNYVTGCVAEEARVSVQMQRGGGATEEEAHEAFLALPRDTFPTLSRLAAITTKPDWDGEFAYGVQVLLDGLHARLK
jgi:AcrR family transcriptional regulator